MLQLEVLIWEALTIDALSWEENQRSRGETTKIGRCLGEDLQDSGQAWQDIKMAFMSSTQAIWGMRPG